MSSVFSLQEKRIWVAGASGMVGHALLKKLEDENCIILASTRNQLNLLNQQQVEQWIAKHKPHGVFLLAARVGGIYANTTFPAEFIYENIAIQTNVLHACWKNEVEKVLFLGSSCTYPKTAPQPIQEEQLLNGPFEPTNEWYAVAKVAGIKMCQAYQKQYGSNFIVGMPTNVYGEHDHFNLKGSHVVPALIRRLHEAKKTHQKSVEIWGTGRPLRELMHVDDLADACLFLMKNYSSKDIINIGCQEEITIKHLAEKIKHIVGFEGHFSFDPSKPDGLLRKALDSSKLFALGWRPQVPLEEGLQRAYAWYRTHC